ncbi:MAG: xylose isomerase [Phycisphaeraceae bacterium]|jgi:xylose isomerase|nr:xylose isomerase [Phycisphaeraceae bacterium]MDP7347948.1 xylose isomerase [Phycisphaeraceae bacterium]
MAKADPFLPTSADKFTFGLWTVGNPGRDPFGEPTRARKDPVQLVDLLGGVGGVYGVNFHDNDLVPIDASPTEAAAVKKDFKAALKRNKLRVPMATTNLFTDPIFKDGAFTSNDAHVRAYAIQKTMRAMDLGAEMGAKFYVFWGGREGTDTNASKDPVRAMHWFRDAINFLCEYNIAKKYGYKFALEAKPNEPRGHLFAPSTGSYLGFITTLRHPEMVGVNPEFAHEQMAGLNFPQVVAEALAAGKLFHIDLNDQEVGRFDQDLRFASQSYKHAFFLVKLLTDYNYRGPKHFDSHAYRTADYADVKAFATGSMRSYKILEHKARLFDKDRRIQALLKKICRESGRFAAMTRTYSAKNARALLDIEFDREKLAARPLPYEQLDQLVFELLMGVR